MHMGLSTGKQEGQAIACPSRALIQYDSGPGLMGLSGIHQEMGARTPQIHACKTEMEKLSDLNVECRMYEGLQG